LAGAGVCGNRLENEGFCEKGACPECHSVSEKWSCSVGFGAQIQSPYRAKRFLKTLLPRVARGYTLHPGLPYLALSARKTRGLGLKGMGFVLITFSSLPFSSSKKRDDKMGQNSFLQGFPWQGAGLNLRWFWMNCFLY
jgi:hypothetical protein